MSIQRLPRVGLRTERLILQPACRGDTPDLLAYYVENRQHLQPWEPSRADDFYTLDALASRLDGMEKVDGAWADHVLSSLINDKA